MSYPDPPPLPPHPFMLPPYSDGNAGGFWPQVQMNRDYLDSYSQFEQPPPFKRSRNSDNNPPNFVPSAPSNPRMMNPIPPVNRGTTHIFYKTRMCTKFLEGNCKNGDSCTFAHGPEDLREPPPNWQELVKDRVAVNWNDDQKIIHRMKICKKFYNGEECPFGVKCNFLHESPAKFRGDLAAEMAMVRERQSSVISIGSMGAMELRSVNDRYDLNKHLNSSSDAFQININADSDVSRVNMNANTDISRVNMNANTDVSRVNMNANSDSLRATMKNMHWKTKICTKWEVGMCPFGERCHYAHGQSELQILNGRSEPHDVMMNAPGSVAVNPSPVVTISDVPPTIPIVATPYKEGSEAKKGFAKWNPHKKINRIYGDWIDDLTPPHSFPKDDWIES